MMRTWLSEGRRRHGGGGEQIAEIEALLAAGLHQQVGAAHQVLGAPEAETGGKLADFLPERPEEGRLVDDAVFQDPRDEALQPAPRRLFGRGDLGGDPHVAGIEMAAAAGGAADDHHRQGAEADPVGSQKHQLDHVAAAAGAAVGPDFHFVAQSRPGEGLVRLTHADFRRQAHELDGVLAGGAGAAVVAADGDDVGARLGDPQGDGADPRHRRDFHRDARLRVGGAQLLDDLGEVLDGVDVVVVGGGDEAHSRGRRCGRRRSSPSP